ncbi:hypothetical protein [Curtobacterium sp. VKM Ac-1393]|uniref:hypothetical protein n=1 Tax=Curtobacterium sp. VKM Ac-1393 TaxID=2783814 RepID=UPI00188C8965|nr:hypothetical protein [Curtobacterium sp. VKM Ac-1393]MBF4609114.1 hypothetical protein [Curtobacterium sp. VKM Ac-1393]
MSETESEPSARDAPSESKDHRPWLYVMAGAVVLVGIVVLRGSLPAPAGFPAFTTWPPTLAPAGATLMVGGLAGVVALAASVSWRKQRARDEVVEQRRRENDRAYETWKTQASHYDTLAVSVIQQFVGSIDLQAMAADRGRAVLWGSAAVVRALEQWDVAAISAREKQAERGHGDLDDMKKGELWTALAHLIRTMRGELPGDLREVLPNRTVLRAVFGDFRYLDDHDLLPSTVLDAVDE